MFSSSHSLNKTHLAEYILIHQYFLISHSKELFSLSHFLCLGPLCIQTRSLFLILLQSYCVQVYIVHYIGDLDRCIVWYSRLSCLVRCEGLNRISCSSSLLKDYSLLGQESSKVTLLGIYCHILGLLID